MIREPSGMHVRSHFHSLAFNPHLCYVCILSIEWDNIGPSGTAWFRAWGRESVGNDLIKYSR